jgi:hypothetical protein
MHAIYHKNLFNGTRVVKKMYQQQLHVIKIFPPSVRLVSNHQQVQLELVSEDRPKHIQSRTLM